MSCVIVIRKARADDEPARAALIRSSYAGYNRDAFFLFFFQELTLQMGVLLGAVLFIFCGVSLRALLLLPPALAAAVQLAVWITHAAIADKRVQEMRKESVGLVAEYHGPLVAEPRRLRPTVVVAEHWRPGGDGPLHTQVVGTASVSEFWGPEPAGWLHGLAVHADWRRRGAGAALARAAALCVQAGALHAVLSELQSAAACTLRGQGFRPRAAYHRRLCGARLTLALQHLAVDLPTHV
ncbi:uncharacterized protein LOC128680561 isoform X1 [Plodia interpunctella]|uniref:uncharacterized protein LOC128680561 isoform X1 n=1 Tax=Plodia interpunctella TaxID=58824 RepID=UPI0023680B91|nr:uncharacterized protein LOC128680561 isoform X1 [Plodia interpunctella]